VTRAVVVDIEGTTSSTDFVTATLFPYARERFATYVAAHRESPALRARVDEVRREIGEPDGDDARVIAALEQWSDADRKFAPLKTIQGWIWQEAFAHGELTSHFYPDVVPALRRWNAAGLTLAVFSSGSVDAQRAWFAHSPDGDLSPLIRANFDTENAGPKREADSYRKIAAELACAPEAILFLSDVTAELDAARAAGWSTIGVRRAGEPSFDAGVGDHREINSFADLERV
jgi:2,3-diketo-5-methylthio-1-phosphopentane phosphatase